MLQSLMEAGYRPVSKDQMMRRLWTNEVSYDKSGRHVAITVYLSPNGGDYALGEKAFRDNWEALKRGDIDGGRVFLADRQRGRAICIIPFADMAERLEGKTLRGGQYGPYFWINAHGYPPQEVEDFPDERVPM